MSRSPKAFNMIKNWKMKSISPSPQTVKKKPEIQIQTLEKEVDYWRLKYLEMEETFKDKQQYFQLEAELELWKSKYNQLQIRARVIKGSELIIEEQQQRIKELNNHIQNRTYETIKIDNYEQSELQQEINLLKEKLKQSQEQNKKQLENSQSEAKLFQQNKKVEQENRILQEQLSILQSENEKLNDYYKYQLDQFKQKDTQLQYNSIDHRQQLEQLNNEIIKLRQNLRDQEKFKKLELQQKDEFYNSIIQQLRSQISNQIQSGEMRLNTIQSILKEQKVNTGQSQTPDIRYQSFQGSREYDSRQSKYENDSIKQIIRTQKDRTYKY
ncbi:hypothetical protein pb186bvf_012318 [Paramecium bursaria]